MEERKQPDATGNPSPNPRPSAAPARRRRFWLYAGLAGVAGALATLAACAQHGPGQGWGHHHGWHGPMDPERIAQRVDKVVERVLSEVDATAEQKQKVSGIAKQTLADLAPMREKHQAARRQAVELLAAASVDRAALERLRADELRMAEDASKRLAQSLADIAEVLTPEQRTKLKERLDRRMARRWS